jgi:hypothetical protein
MKTCNRLLGWLVLFVELSLAPTLHAQAGADAPAEWQARFARARSQLLADDCRGAARELTEIELTAASEVDHARAAELASFARARCELRAGHDQPSLRTSDELTVLYSLAVIYGLGTGAWIALQLRPENFGSALLPFVITTPATLAAVALADNYRPLRHGIPHAIAAGLYLGLGEGIWLTGYQNAHAAKQGSTRWSAERVSSALWMATSVGALAGGLIGAWRRPTPGRVSFTASAAIWGGLLSAFTAGAVVSERAERTEGAFVIGSMGYNAGLVAGLLFGPSVAPSVTRVRLSDLGGLFGGLAFAGGYALLASHRDARLLLGAAAIGSGLGLGITWWATSDMPADRSHDALPPAFGARRSSGMAALQPILAPLSDGVFAGVSGELPM